MKITEDILDYIQSLEKQIFKKYLLFFMIGFFLILASATYFIHIQSKGLALKIGILKTLAKKASLTASSYKIVQDKKNSLMELLEIEKNFDIKSFFENFCREQSIKPEANWPRISSPVFNNDLLQEVSLQITFKNLNMQTITKVLETLESKKIVYVKSIKITKDQQGIILDLNIGSLIQKPKV